LEASNWAFFCYVTRLFWTKSFELVCATSTASPQTIALFRKVNRYVGNLAPMPGVFPDYPAPVIRNTGEGEGRELVMMRWGMPPPPHSGGDQHPQHQLAALAWLAEAGEPLSGAVQLLRRVRAGAEPGDEEGRGLVRAQ
jgi:putative SOS response-associated peptidase YedK